MIKLCFGTLINLLSLIKGDDIYPVEFAPQSVERVLIGRANIVVIRDKFSSTYFMEDKRHFYNVSN